MAALSPMSFPNGHPLDVAAQRRPTTANHDPASSSVVDNRAGRQPELPTNGKFTITLNAARSTDTDVTCAFSAAVDASDDYLTLVGTVTIAAGQRTAEIRVSAFNVALVKGTERVKVILTGFGVLNPALTRSSYPMNRAVTVSVCDDDINALAISSATAVEGTLGTMTLTFAVTSSSALNVGFAFAFHRDEFATDGSDYVVSSGSPVLFTGVAGETRTITIGVSAGTTRE